MDLTTDSLLLALALNHRLSSTLAPDEVSAAFLDDDRDVPLIVSDAVLGTTPPTGLLLFAAEAAAAGITHARLALHHPSLPHTTPPVDKADRTKVGRHPAPIVLHRGTQQLGIVLIGAEANVEVLACRETVFRPVTVETPAEALRRLRLLVMEGLSLIESIDVPAEWREGPWRDWQEELSTSHPISRLIPRAADSRAIYAALDIHHRMASVLAPATVEPPEFGGLLSRLHPAAADYIMAVATMKGVNDSTLPVQLLVMDVDSTFINEEVIDLIAVHADVGEQVADITERAMAGELDFAASLAERVALLDGLPVSVLDEVRAQISLTEGARELVAAVQEAGGVVALVSGGFTPIIAPVAAELGIEEVHANGLEIVDDHLTGRTSGRVIDPSAKAEIFTDLARRYECEPARTVAIGDGANDIGMIEAAGLGVAFCAKPALAQVADAAVTTRDLREVLTLIAARTGAADI